MRPGEENGREYYFLTEDEFKQWAAEGKFLEWACYGGNLYGTPSAPVEEKLETGSDVVLEIELAGAWQVYENRPGCLMIFIMPPSIAELERRLRGRKTESEGSILRRMARAREEIAEVESEMGPQGLGRFDYVIVNDSISRAADEVARAILRAREEDEQAHYR